MALVTFRISSGIFLVASPRKLLLLSTMIFNHSEFVF